ncbi:MAG: polysaccharide pyruvyl transferase family protein [Phycisphaerae bacterium]|nr:polysaccharide pyruvyl transferase family protein [Saprospiraceae bacterium]
MRNIIQEHVLKIAIITTVKHNIGDDFVREGILYLLDSIKELSSVELIHKHIPISAVHGLEKIRSYRVSKALDPLARLLGSKNRVNNADVLIQSGAPVYWCHPDGPHCADNEWFDPLIRKRFLPDRRGRKFLNIAGGSCQRYHSDGSEIDSCPACSAYIREFFDACDLTILRDKLAQTMLKKAGREASVLPCTSIFARDRLGLNALNGEYIVLNFMENGGHFTFGQNIDANLWRSQFKQIAAVAKKHGRVIIACHTPDEENLASLLVPEYERFLVPDDHVEFMKFYSRAIFGIVNRVHAGFVMASFGKPVVVIGNDSRALMIENLNLPSIFVGDVEHIGVESIINKALSRVSSYSDEIEAIRSRAKSEYTLAIGNALEV